MNLFRLTFFLILFLLGCDSFDNTKEKEIVLDKNKILKDFKSKFSSIIPEDSLVTISAIKDSPIEGLKEGVILFKKIDETQQLTFFISNNGKYIIFQPQIYDFSGPIRNPDLMNLINLTDVPRTNNTVGAIRIVEYSDFQCPACKYGSNQVKRLQSEYGEKITFYYKHYPLKQHKWADEAAFFTSCVYDTFGQEAFWKSHDLIFDNQDQFNELSFNEVVGSVFVSEVKFNYSSCLDKSEKYKKFVKSSVDEGVGIGIRSTPTFIVEGHIVPGADYMKIKEAIDSFIKN